MAQAASFSAPHSSHAPPTGALYAGLTGSLAAAPPAAALQDRLQRLQCLEALASVKTAAALSRWASNELQVLLPHGLLLFAVAELRQRDFKLHKLLPGAWPPGYFDALRRADNSIQCPLVARWIALQSPQFHDVRRPDPLPEPAWTQLNQDFQLGNMAVHGQRDIDSPTCSLFVFARLPEVMSPSCAELLELLVPHMHAALLRCLTKLQIVGEPESAPSVRLTPREREVLGWMIEGKTNWEIAQIGGRSEHTVRHQVARLLAKLKASNRAQAVAKAMAQKLHL